MGLEFRGRIHRHLLFAPSPSGYSFGKTASIQSKNAFCIRIHNYPNLLLEAIAMPNESLLKERDEILNEEPVKRRKLEHQGVSNWVDEDFVPPEDWPPLVGEIDLAIHDLPHKSSNLEWWYLNAHLADQNNPENKFSIFASFF